MAKLSPLQKVGDGDSYDFDPMSLRQDSAPDKVMFNVQGPLHLEKPLSVDGTNSAPEEKKAYRNQSMQNKDAQ